MGWLGWPLRRIQRTTGVRRETISAYLKQACLPVRVPRTSSPPKPAIVVLSACDIGVGSVGIWQGVYGPRLAFLTTGAETLITENPPAKPVGSFDSRSRSKRLVCHRAVLLSAGRKPRQPKFIAR